MLLLLSLAFAAGTDLRITLPVPPTSGTPASVEAAVHPLDAELLACFPEGAGLPMAVAVDVGADGVVTKTAVPVPKGSEAERCALGVLGRMRLAAAPHSGTVLLGIEAGAAATGTPVVRFDVGAPKLDPSVASFLSGGGIVGMRGVQRGTVAPAAPTGPKVTVGSVAIEGELDRAVVEGLATRSLEGALACHRQAVGASATLEGVLVVGLAVGKDGGVTSMTAESSTMHDEALDRCLTDQLVGAQLGAPADGKKARVTWPLTFQPG